MPKKTNNLQLPLDAQFAQTSAPGVPAIREAVRSWRDDGYRGATATTRELLKHWFQPDGHRLPNGRRFQYHYFQRDAIETLIYLWEVEGLRSFGALGERFIRTHGDLRLLQHDLFARYAVKMATGSGKTKVISLAIVWQYLNAARSEGDDYAKTFLLIAPNVIVYERLRTDFEGKRIFTLDPLIPRHMQIFWDFDVVLRGEGERAPADGMLYLTNIQQLYEREEHDDDAPDPLLDVLGPAPKPQIVQARTIRERIAERDGALLVINDEAHHTHDEGSEWNNVIRTIHDVRPLAAQLDFSATPRFQKGQLFPWTVFDYPLKQAILDNVVKRPVKGVANIEETKSDIASTRYQGFLVAGVERWREYREQLAPLGKKPLLFVMLNSTAEADDVGHWLQTKYPGEFGGDKTSVIHTRLNGEIVDRDLEKAREIARNADRADVPANAIVSVLMLREGWDVQNVTVIVGLRPYTSKAKILPEQTIGRGLRLMFRGSSAYTERVDVIGNQAFIDFVDDLEKIEDLKLDTFKIGKDKLTILTIQPEPETRGQYDIGLPKLTPTLLRKKSLADEIAALDVLQLETNPLPIKPGDANERNFRYEGKDIITLETLIEREYTIPDPRTSGEVIGFYAKLIAGDLKLPSQFAALVPQIKRFFEHKAFGQTVDLDDPTIISAMNRNVAAFVVRESFKKALGSVLIEQAEPALLVPERKLATCPPFPYSRPTYAATKSIFNVVPCDNELERAFAKFLDRAEDVAAFAKLPEQFGFTIEYVDGAANMRYYEPDFVARLTDGSHWLIETKGAETVEVAHKDAAARLWCANATELTGTTWRYLKVGQKSFEQLQPSDFGDLLALE